jgi:hypothetical protein
MRTMVFASAGAKKKLRMARNNFFMVYPQIMDKVIIQLSQ